LAASFTLAFAPGDKAIDQKKKCECDPKASRDPEPVWGNAGIRLGHVCWIHNFSILRLKHWFSFGSGQGSVSTAFNGYWRAKRHKSRNLFQ
jgi:hypothetical protein